MGQMSAREIARNEMLAGPWKQLEPVKAYESALFNHILANIGGYEFNAAGMTEANRLGAEFQYSWPYTVPGVMEMVEADEKGKLAEKIAELNERFRREVANAEASSASESDSPSDHGGSRGEREQGDR